MRKSPAVAYYAHKLKITPRSKIIIELEEAPLSHKDKIFMKMILEGASYKELSEAFNKSEARIYQWKRQLFERLTEFDSENQAENSFP